MKDIDNKANNFLTKMQNFDKGARVKTQKTSWTSLGRRLIRWMSSGTSNHPRVGKLFMRYTQQALKSVKSDRGQTETETPTLTPKQKTRILTSLKRLNTQQIGTQDKDIIQHAIKILSPSMPDNGNFYPAGVDPTGGQASDVPELTNPEATYFAIENLTKGEMQERTATLKSLGEAPPLSASELSALQKGEFGKDEQPLVNTIISKSLVAQTKELPAGEQLNTLLTKLTKTPPQTAEQHAALQANIKGKTKLTDQAMLRTITTNSLIFQTKGMKPGPQLDTILEDLNTKSHQLTTPNQVKDLQANLKKTTLSPGNKATLKSIVETSLIDMTKTLNTDKDLEAALKLLDQQPALSTSQLNTINKNLQGKEFSQKTKDTLGSINSNRIIEDLQGASPAAAETMTTNILENQPPLSGKQLDALNANLKKTKLTDTTKTNIAKIAQKAAEAVAPITKEKGAVKAAVTAAFSKTQITETETDTYTNGKIKVGVKVETGELFTTKTTTQYTETGEIAETKTELIRTGEDKPSETRVRTFANGQLSSMKETLVEGDINKTVDKSYNDSGGLKSETVESKKPDGTFLSKVSKHYLYGDNGTVIVSVSVFDQDGNEQADQVTQAMTELINAITVAKDKTGGEFTAALEVIEKNLTKPGIGEGVLYKLAEADIEKLQALFAGKEITGEDAKLGESIARKVGQTTYDKKMAHYHRDDAIYDAVEPTATISGQGIENQKFNGFFACGTSRYLIGKDAITSRSFPALMAGMTGGLKKNHEALQKNSTDATSTAMAQSAPVLAAIAEGIEGNEAASLGGSPKGPEGHYVSVGSHEFRAFDAGSGPSGKLQKGDQKTVKEYQDGLKGCEKDDTYIVGTGGTIAQREERMDKNIAAGQKNIPEGMSSGDFIKTLFRHVIDSPNLEKQISGEQICQGIEKGRIPLKNGETLAAFQGGKTDAVMWSYTKDDQGKVTASVLAVVNATNLSEDQRTAGIKALGALFKNDTTENAEAKRADDPSNVAYPKRPRKARAREMITKLDTISEEPTETDQTLIQSDRIIGELKTAKGPEERMMLLQSLQKQEPLTFEQARQLESMYKTLDQPTDDEKNLWELIITKSTESEA